MNGRGIKTLRVSDFPEDAWVIMGEGDGSDRDMMELYEAVDFLYRGVTIRAQKLASVPFVVTRTGGAVFYDSEEGKPAPAGFDWLEDLPILLEKIEAAVVLSGRAYVRPLGNTFGFIRELQWFKPSSVTPWYDVATGELLHFIRYGPQEMRIRPEDLIYFWPPDPTVETGPAIRYDGKAAMSAAGVLANMDEFLEHYFGRGAIKVTLLTSEGMIQKGQREILKEWWQKVVAGVTNAFGAEVVNAKKVTPVVIGEGVKDLENTALTKEKREAICAALGVPVSKVLPEAANYATKQSDDVMLVTDTIIPELRWIGRTLNRQLFTGLGLSIKFKPEELTEMQTDEAARAESLVNLTTAGLPLLMAMEVLGYDLAPEWQAKLEEIERQKEEMREAGAQALAQGAQQGGPPSSNQDDQDKAADKTYELARELEEAKRFERWLKNDPDRDPADFATDILSDEAKRRIKAVVDGKLVPRGMPSNRQPPSPMELSDPSDIARLVTDVEKWARRHGLDLDKLLTAEDIEDVTPTD